MLAFIGSFTTDYTSVAGEAEETGDPLVVWVNNSRFQSSLIKKMADAAFTPRTGIPVSIRITSIGTGVSPMLLATAAAPGQTPPCSWPTARRSTTPAGARRWT